MGNIKGKVILVRIPLVSISKPSDRGDNSFANQENIGGRMKRIGLSLSVSVVITVICAKTCPTARYSYSRSADPAAIKTALLLALGVGLVAIIMAIPGLD